MSNPRQGVLIYDGESGRFDIRFSLEEYYGGLHCGTCFEVLVGRRWVPTRIEHYNRWYGYDGRFDQEQKKTLLLFSCPAAA